MHKRMKENIVTEAYIYIVGLSRLIFALFNTGFIVYENIVTKNIPKNFMLFLNVIW